MFELVDCKIEFVHCEAGVQLVISREVVEVRIVESKVLADVLCERCVPSWVIICLVGTHFTEEYQQCTCFLLVRNSMATTKWRIKKRIFLSCVGC